MGSVRTGIHVCSVYAAEARVAIRTRLPPDEMQHGHAAVVIDGVQRELELFELLLDSVDLDIADFCSVQNEPDLPSVVDPLLPTTICIHGNRHRSRAATAG